jgi:hypothetical protein
MLVAGSGCVTPLTRHEHAARHVYRHAPQSVGTEARRLLQEQGYPPATDGLTSFQTASRSTGARERTHYEVRVRETSQGCQVDFTGVREAEGRRSRFPDYDLAYELMIRVDPEEAQRRPTRNSFENWWKRNTQCNGLML